VRRRQLRGLLAHLDADPGRARAVVGDFNATPLWPVYRGVASRLEDLARTHARGTGRRPGRTWPSWSRRPLLRIDHCFGRGLDVHGLRVVPVPGSDHCGLLVDLFAK
jgi:endonuclease/exonuclease/phosphatase (EEP) superfamily protein YafD